MGGIVRKTFFDMKTTVVYVVVILLFTVLSLAGNEAVNAFSNVAQNTHRVIIDAGHGGVDGGAVSCTGIYESSINLDFALKLNDLLHLLGIRTVMIRTTDESVYTEGTTIAAKKVSDLKERVRIVNGTPNALLISIHQNYFHDGRYSGSQVFYGGQKESKQLAEHLQGSFRAYMDANNTRQAKKSSGVYLMEHSNCPAVLIECGFLSNPSEERQLLDESYQKKMCSVIAATLSQYLNT